MRTDVSNNNSVHIENTLKADSIKGKVDELKVVKGVRRTLQPLQKTAGDKENLVGAGRSPMPGNKEKLLTLSEPHKPSKKLKPSEPRQVTAADLTTDGNPSSEYWESLAERRRIALESALEENQKLTERISILQEENAQANLLLVESREIIEGLTELLNEKEDAEAQEDE